MSKVLVFSDLHMVPGECAEGPDPDARLAAALAHAARFNGESDLAVFCGDLAHDGDVASYTRLRARLARSGFRQALLLGNHDNRENFRAVFGEAGLDADGFVQGVADLPEARLIWLDTLAGPPYVHPEGHAGLLCAQRLAWLDARLAEADRPAIVFMHHPPHDTGFRAMDAIKLRDGAAFHDLIARHGTVRHIVCGHVHRTISGSHRGVPFSVFKGMLGQMPLVFDATDVHIAVDEPPAYGILLIGTEGVVVHSEDFGLTDLAAVRAAAGCRTEAPPSELHLHHALDHVGRIMSRLVVRGIGGIAQFDAQPSGLRDVEGAEIAEADVGQAVALGIGHEADRGHHRRILKAVRRAF